MSKIRTTIARVAIMTLPVIGVVAAASPAYAQKPRQGSTPATCDVYDSGTGKTTQVPEGSRVGLFYCGSDGEWHFGTVQLDWRAATSTQPPLKSVTVASASAVTVAAR